MTINNEWRPRIDFGPIYTSVQSTGPHWVIQPCGDGGRSEPAVETKEYSAEQQLQDMEESVQKRVDAVLRERYERRQREFLELVVWIAAFCAAVWIIAAATR